MQCTALGDTTVILSVYGKPKVVVNVTFHLRWEVKIKTKVELINIPPSPQNLCVRDQWATFITDLIKP